ncbi:Mitogen-activated protein kinase kinase kinase [Thalictrum thalictroides]|uniref:Mitogen-activated protein kinase kinase kinase n=1 Tax=Thalictrum thalictroides TaxID=46969 RepID=A0A7J6W960_THATH|nr:Mitogen-activated protein kinase kinase kinase [Thalictrum thalictroides]
MDFEEEEVWRRVKMIGKGGFGTVSLALTNPKHLFLPPVLAVKSAELSSAHTLAKEAHILPSLQGSPYIIGFYSHGITVEGKEGKLYFNLLLEYASLGSLGDRIADYSGCFKGLPEAEVMIYTRSILKGLKHIHKNNYVHCDIKPDNILLAPSYSEDSLSGVEIVPKIADFGLAKRVGKKVKKDTDHLRGTALYMAPESIVYNEFEPHTDVWALGCVVLEMLTGRQAWNLGPDDPLSSLLNRIGYSNELPVIPGKLSLEAKDFVNKCLVKNTALRWSPDMLLKHPFVTIDNNDEQTFRDKTGEAALGVVPSSIVTVIQSRKDGKRKERTDKVTEMGKWPSFISLDSNKDTTDIPLNDGKRRRIANEVENTSVQFTPDMLLKQSCSDINSSNKQTFKEGPAEEEANQSITTANIMVKVSGHHS